MDNKLRLWTITKRLLHKAKPAKLLLTVSTLANICNSICHAGLMAFGALMVLCSFGRCHGSVADWGCGMLLCAVGIFAFRYIDGYISHSAAYELLADMRVKLYRQLRKLAPACLTSRTKGDILSVAVGDIETIEHFFAHTIGPMFTVILLPIATIVGTACVNPKLIPVLLPVYLINSLVLPIGTLRSGQKIGNAYHRELGELKSLILESICGIRDIQIFGDGQRQKQKIMQKTKEISKSAHALILYQQVVSSIPTFFIYLARLLFVVVAAGFSAADGTSSTKVIVLSFLVSSTFSSTQSLAGVAASLIETYAAAVRIFELEDRQPEIVESQTAVALTKIDTIELIDLGFRYPNTNAAVLEHVNAKFHAGEKIGLAGKSGAGKSTLLRLLLRFWRPSEGQILINGAPIETYTLESLRQRIGMLGQDTFLFNDTIAANIAVGRPDASREEIRLAAAQAGISELIDSLPEQYETQMGEMGDRLSGGEKQRIGIARLLLYHPDVIVMDEPTSNLDAFHERELLHTLETACADKMLILVSHRQSTLANCTRQFQIQDLKLAERSPDVSGV